MLNGVEQEYYMSTDGAVQEVKRHCFQTSDHCVVDRAFVIIDMERIAECCDKGTHVQTTLGEIVRTQEDLADDTTISWNRLSPSSFDDISSQSDSVTEVVESDDCGYEELRINVVAITNNFVEDMWAREAAERPKDVFWQSPGNCTGPAVYATVSLLFHALFNERTMLIMSEASAFSKRHGRGIATRITV